MQLPFRLRDFAEEFVHHRERFRFIDAAGDHEHRVVRLIVVAIERLQPLDRRAFDVGLFADRRVTVIVPLENGGQHPLVEHTAGTVLAALEFVAHDAELLLEVRAGDERVDHAIRFEFERPAQVLVGRGKGLVIIGAIEPRGAVGARAVLGQFLRNVRMLRRALENEMLEQMRHSRLAVILMPRTDLVGDVHRDDRFRRIRKKQHAKPVRQAVFRDAFHRGDPLDACRQDHGCGLVAEAQPDEKKRGEKSNEFHEPMMHPRCVQSSLVVRRFRAG